MSDVDFEGSFHDDEEITLEELIGDIESETALQLLNSVYREIPSPDSPRMTGLPELDAKLSMGTVEDSDLSLDPPMAPSLGRGEVLEIQGPACSGKTHLTYQLVVSCILPKEVLITIQDANLSSHSKLIRIGGWEHGAVIMDCDGRWNVNRLSGILRRRINMHLPPDEPTFSPGIEDLLRSCLERLHIFQPTSTLSLAYTVAQLPNYHSQHMVDWEISLLIVDSISSFYWQDRNTFEQQQALKAKSKDFVHPMDRVLVALQEFRVSYGPAIVLTNWGLSFPKQAANAVNPATSSFILYRQHINPFPSPFELPVRNLQNAHLYPPITLHITLDHPYFDDRRKDTTYISGILRIIPTGVTDKIRIRLNSV